MLASSLRRIAGLVLALALPVGASAIELRDEFRAAIEQGIANGRYQSIAVGLLDNGEQSQWLFGAVEPGGAKPTANTVYEIGSTTRCFTGLLLADAVLARKLRLTTRSARSSPTSVSPIRSSPRRRSARSPPTAPAFRRSHRTFFRAASTIRT